MTSLFSAVSGHFTRVLVLGTLLPVSLFVLVVVLLVIPLLPPDPALLRPLQTLDTEWKALALTMSVVFLTGLLYNLNAPLVRAYEGYLWRSTWFGVRRTRRYQGQVVAARTTLARLIALRRQLNTAAPPTDLNQKLQAQLGILGRLLNTRFPSEELVLPTRLGNVIRSFEEYPQRQYGMSAIALWPRLIAAIDKDYLSSIDEAKSALDFSLHSSFLCVVLAACIIGIGAVTGRAFASANAFMIWAAIGWSFALLAHLLYLAAIACAEAWGAHVKAAFDLYRWSLLGQLGYQQKPTTRAEERALWGAISRQVVFGDPVENDPLPYGVSHGHLDEALP